MISAQPGPQLLDHLQKSLTCTIYSTKCVPPSLPTIIQVPCRGCQRASLASRSMQWHPHAPPPATLPQVDPGHRTLRGSRADRQQQGMPAGV